jgi:hypothetical protein
MQAKSSDGLHKWLITLSILFIPYLGLVLSVICIYALPDKTVNPFAGAAYFAGGVIAVIPLVLLRWKKDKAIQLEAVTDTCCDSRIIIKESLSDKILRWIVTIFSILIAGHGLTLTRICTYGMPDKSMQPMAGALYFLATAGLLATLVFAIWSRTRSLKLLREESPTT